MLLFFYNLLFGFCFLLYLPFFIIKLRRRGGVDATYRQRFGLFTAEQKEELAALDSPIWIHACSVGETVAALTFIRRWLERSPTAKIVLSTTTTTGHALAAKKKPADVTLVYCPLDFYFCVRSTLNAIRPAMLVIFEVEIWPNLILQANKRGIPVTLANGRMSDNSAQGYRKHRWFFRRLFEAFSAICVQTKEDAERVRLVVPDAPVTACNTMKFDQIPDSNADETVTLKIQQQLDKTFGTGERLVFVAGSTHSGEEELVLKTLKTLLPKLPDLKLVLVPRHVERTADIETTLHSQGIKYQLLLPGENPQPEEEVPVLVVNTTGELMNYYAAADIVFVGKSLAGNEGGHNIIEPAIFGKAILHGAAMQNFRDVVRLFQNAEAAVELASDAELAEEILRLGTDPAARQKLGQRAREVVDRHRGAIDATLDILLQIENRSKKDN